jgi:hypothetical protein
MQGSEAEGTEGADARVELAVPGDDGALGDVELGGDAREAEAFGTELGEPVFSVSRTHGASFRIVGAKDQRLRWLHWLYWLFFRGRAGK